MLKCVKIILYIFFFLRSEFTITVRNKNIKEIIAAIIIRHIIYRKPQNKFRHKLKVNFSQTCGAT
jgi:hypothetical protein